MKHGSRPTNVYHRNYSYELTFGATEALPMPTEYDCDNGQTMPDQNADKNPYECTDYTLRDIRTDNDGILYIPGYNYSHTLLIEGKAATQQGVVPMDAFRSSQVYGLLPVADAPESMLNAGEGVNADYRNWPTTLDAKAGLHRNGQYFDVDKVSGSYFLGIQNALWGERLSRRSIAVGSPWFPEWENHTGANGILPDFYYSGIQSQYIWHEYKCSGFTTKNSQGQLIRNGDVFLRLKSWQGKYFGDQGWVYLDAAKTEKLFAIYGTSLFIPAQAAAADIKLVKLTMLETLLSYYNRLIQLISA